MDANIYELTMSGLTLLGSVLVGFVATVFVIFLSMPFVGTILNNAREMKKWWNTPNMELSFKESRDKDE